MWIESRYWLALCFCGAMWLGGCGPAAWQSRPFVGVALEPGRYLDKVYRNPNFQPAAAVYRVETFPLEQVSGIGPEQARVLFNEELIRAMTANGLRVSWDEFERSRTKPEIKPEESRANRPKPEASQAKSLLKPQTTQEQPTSTSILSGLVDRLAVASPTWRFFSGRGHADLRVVGEIRQGQEVMFAFQDEVRVNPPVNPKHRPPMESDLIARLAIRRFTANFLNELLLPTKTEPEISMPATAPPNR